MQQKSLYMELLYSGSVPTHQVKKLGKWYLMYADKSVTALLGYLGDNILKALSNLFETTDEEMTQKEGVLLLDMPKKIVDWIKVLSTSMNIVCCSFDIEDEDKEIYSCLGPAGKNWRKVLSSRTERIPIDMPARFDFEDEIISLWLEPSENLAKMLREQLELTKNTYSSLEFAGESKEMVVMWERALELASKLADFLGDIDERYRILSDNTAKKVERKMKDIWNWAGSTSFRQRLNHFMNIEEKLMHLCASASKEAVPQFLMSRINKQQAFVTPEESAFCKLIQHFKFMEWVHSALFVQSRLDFVADEAAQLKLLMMERIGKMRALMMPCESLSEQQPELLKKDELQIWRRAEKFPLRKTWNNINRHHNFVLPITNCSMLSHLYISDCRLAIPPNAEPHIKGGVASTIISSSQSSKTTSNQRC